MLTQEQIDSFHSNGYLIMRGVYQDEELRLLTQAVNQIQAQGEAREGEHSYRSGPDGDQVYWRSEDLWNRGDIFKAVTVKPEALENIGQCIGQPFFPWNDSLVVKLARQGTAVNWHQDPPYMGGTREATYPVPNFTTDIYLDYSGPDNGCVWAIPGHHLVGSVDLEPYSQEDLFKHPGARPIEMEPGDLLFHALSTPHGSGHSRSHRQRRIFYIHYLADEVYRDGYGAFAWASGKPGWGEARKAIVDSMFEARASFGWDNYQSSLAYGEGGFTFAGQPTTPPGHWETLASAIPSNQRARLKSLEE